MKLERRHHRMMITRNTEYHLRDGECVGVRDRRSMSWLLDHPALRGVLLGGMDRRSRLFQRPIPGTRLLFAKGSKDVLTSPLTDEDRPEKHAPLHYTWRARSGVIDLAA